MKKERPNFTEYSLKICRILLLIMLIITFSSRKVLAQPVLLLFELIFEIEKILRITVQLQPHQFDFPLKTRMQIICLRDFTSTSPREAVV